MIIVCMLWLTLIYTLVAYDELMAGRGGQEEGGRLSNYAGGGQTDRQWFILPL